MVGLVAGHKSPYASSEVIKVERHAIYSISNIKSWRQGVVGSRRWIVFYGHRYEAGIVRRCGGVDGRRVWQDQCIYWSLIGPQNGTAEEGGN